MPSRAQACASASACLHARALQDTSALLRATPELLTCPSPLEDSMCALARVLVPPLELPELAGLLTAHPGVCAHLVVCKQGALSMASLRVLVRPC